MTMHNRNRFATMEAVLAEAMRIVKESNASVTEEDIFKLMIASCPTQDIEGVPHFRFQDVSNFILNLNQAIQAKDSSYLKQKRGLRVDKIIDVEEFVESSEYMNQRGYIRSVVKKGLIELFHGENDYIECVLTGAIGWGKTYFADLSMAYMLYTLSCYHNPQVEFDLAPGSSIYFIQQSKKYELAKKVVFEQFSEKLRLSKYFTKEFPFDPHVKSELRFPKNIHVLPVGGADTAALGMNVYGGIIDEMNFMARISDSEQTKYTGEDEYDQAERVYRTLIRRMKSRFMQKGRLPGKLLLISSVNYPGDFTDRKVKEAQFDKTILALSYSQWEALPVDRFCGENFLVELGSDTKRPRILKDIVEAIDEADVIQVPIEYHTDFVRDLEAALKDFAGKVCGVSRPFIPYPEELTTAQKKYVEVTGKENLFKYHSIDLSSIIDSEDPDWSKIIDMDYIAQPTEEDDGDTENVILNPQQPFAIHIDVGVTEDAAGLAIGRITGYKKLPSAKIFNQRTKEFVEIADINVPIYHIDGALQIVAPPNGEIDLELIKDMVIWLRGNLYLKWATMDSYQSTMMIQAFRKGQMRSGVLSVDTDIAPYTEVKLAVKDERILLPNSPILSRELREIEKDKEKDKVDHREGGSKDVSDAVAGVVYMLQRKEAVYGTTRIRRKRATEPRNEEEKANRKLRRIRFRH